MTAPRCGFMNLPTTHGFPHDACGTSTDTSLPTSTTTLTIPSRRSSLHHVVYAKNAQCRKGGSSRPLNSFLNQSPFLNSFGCPSFAAPNLAPIKYNATDTFQIIKPICPETKFRVSVPL